jgi:hypothetical protein
MIAADCPDAASSAPAATSDHSGHIFNSQDVIASRLDTPRQIVSKWRKRFAAIGGCGRADIGGRLLSTNAHVVPSDGRC